MKKQLLFVYWCILASPFAVFSQTLIHVADLSFKMSSNSTEEFYYSFAEGDVMVVDFELKKGKGVDFEVIELPNQTKTKQYTARISNYRIKVSSTKVYLFRVTNDLGNKLCYLSIKRIPKSQETVNFNTGWQWKTLYDTTYSTYKEDSLVGHDTIHYTETVTEIASKDLSEIMLVDHTEDIPSVSSMIFNNNPRKCIMVKLPQNEVGPKWEKKVVGWGYWVCVGDHSNSWWSRNKELMVKGAQIAGTSFSPLGSFIAGEITYMLIPDESKVGNVIWAVIDNVVNKNAFMNGDQAYCVRHGDGPGASGTVSYEDKTQGTYYLCLRNDNPLGKIRVNVKVAALMETISYKDVDHQRTKIVPKYIKLTKVKRNISSRQVRVPMEEGK